MLRLFKLLPALLMLAVTLPIHAAGLSAIDVKSVLGQPFRAEIELLGLTADDMLTAQTRIASREEYEKAGVPVTSLTYQLRVSIDERGKDKRFLKITSSGPVNEPAIALIVEFSWRGGRMLQRYSVLLDPPKA
jgi:Tfp pilus assembly protein FimV